MSSMAKREIKKHVSEGADKLPEPTPRPSCATCRYVSEYNDRLFCAVQLPPHVQTSGRAPYVHTTMSCSLYQKK